MTKLSTSSVLRHPRSRRFGWTAALALTAMTLTASAASNVVHSKTGTVGNSVDHIVGVVATSDVCEKGCRYYWPDLVKEVRISHKATASSYYKWTHIDNTKDSKHFSHFKVVKSGANATITQRSLVEGADDAIIAELESKTGYKHAPVFDKAVTTIKLTAEGDKTKVSISATTKVSGFAELFKGKVKEGMVETFNAMMKNYAK